MWNFGSVQVQVCNAHTLVIVESPTKARKIGGFLGDGYIVKASYGHVRQLRKKDGVDPLDNFKMHWEVSSGAQDRLLDFHHHLREVQRLVLATDPDREGEAISWHLLDIFQVRSLLAAIHCKITWST